jgi:hypothetical protein
MSEFKQHMERIIGDADLLLPHKPDRYDPGDRLTVEVTGVVPARHATATLEVEKFVGGGFAGQVYRVRLIHLETPEGRLDGLEVGGRYAVKIIVPPSGFSLFFRNTLYWLAYQGPFSAQVSEQAARSGVLWQKMIRRAARIHLGDETSVVDTFATFFDANLDSYAEINEWVEGRTWRYEVENRLIGRNRRVRKDGRIVDDGDGSREYLEKRSFMIRFVRMLHDLGAPEFARQYEWWTMKSQPNVLKRTGKNDETGGRLTAIDFRAGLALLPILPMSPADFGLIWKGLRRGDLVQFDRGNVEQLEEYCKENRDSFADLQPALEELKVRDKAYRESLPDLTHHHFRLLTDRDLRRSVRQGLVEGWRVRGHLDEEHARLLNSSGWRFLLALLAGVIPFLGRLFRRAWGNSLYRRHLGRTLGSLGYFRRRLRAGRAHTLIGWQRNGRGAELRLERLVDRPVRYYTQRILLGWLPSSWHRFFTEPGYAWDRLKAAVTYPVKLYFNAEFREKWLLDQIDAGHRDGMLTDEEAAQIRSRAKDPFIQKYLKSMAVHVCTVPVTQVVAVILAAWAWWRLGKTWQEGMAYAGGILLFFQATPISPGSLVRGFYVLYLMIRERNWLNYRVAVFVSFWHYVGYLGFPLQMVTEYPSLARFMAGNWAAGIVRIIPVFGERGALFEHWVYDLFFNLPLTIGRIFRRKKKEPA